MPRNEWTIAVVENDEKFLTRILAALDENPNIKKTYTYGSAEEFLYEKQKIIDVYDLALFDIKLKGMNGIELIEAAKTINPNLPIVMITTLSSEDAIFNSLRMGAVGYLWKNELDDLNSEIEKVMNGGATTSPTIAFKVLDYFRKPLQENPKLLTAREKQVLEILASGVSTQKAAQTLNVSVETLRTHIKNIYQKLHVHNRAGMINKAIDIGIL